MAGVPVKFRCYRCNQLLGVSRSKVGAIVACPKCAAELVVPEPVELAPASAASGGPASIGPETAPHHAATAQDDRSPGLDVGLALDFLDIRPEDIRVEPGFAPASTPASDVDENEVEAPVAVPEPTTAAEQVPLLEPTATVATNPPPVETVLSPTIAPAAVTVPPIRLDAPLKRSRGGEQPAPIRGRDLVLPRAVVASWSLFVILALAFAFLAGLLAGHYVWRVH